MDSPGTFLVHPELLWCTGILCHRGHGCVGWVVVLGQSWDIPGTSRVTVVYWDTLPQGAWVSWVDGTVPVHPELLWCTGILCHRGYGWAVVLGQSWYVPSYCGIQGYSATGGMGGW